MHCQHLGQRYMLERADQFDDRLVWFEGDRVVVVEQRSTQMEAVLKQFDRWQEREAKQYLTRRVRELSAQTGLHANRVSFRRQRTRWGSCSIEKNLSLNLKLIELPERLIDYVIIHELAHTEEMNHSRLFWDVVRAHCPDYRQRDAEITQLVRAGGIAFE